MVNPQDVDSVLDPIHRFTWNLMNSDEKKLFMIGGTINALGTILFGILYLNNWPFWYIGIICWAIGLPIMWIARTKAVKRVLNK
ncbi:hypothetical protein ACFL1H_02175 [Nanoarchaeota archaeon]